MYFENFIAKRILKGEGIGIRFTNPLLRIAIAAIALGMTVMIVSILVVTGFRQQITNKVIGFGSHIQITGFDNNYSYEESPISSSPAFLNELRMASGRLTRYTTITFIMKQVSLKRMRK